MVIETSLSKVQIEKKFGEKTIIDTGKSGTVRINRHKGNWLFEIKQGRGLTYGPRFLWKIEIKEGQLMCVRKKTFLEITYLILLIISSLLVPAVILGVISQLFTTRSAPLEIIVVSMGYLATILVFWIIYFFIFSKRTKEAIRDIVQHYILE